MVEKTTWCLSAKNFGSNKRVEPFTQMAMMLLKCYTLSSVQLSHSVVSDSLQPHELQLARPPFP